ncbi:MAG: type II secretion system protein [Pseudomonadota bacterium]
MKKSGKGFTLIEAVIVITITGILAAVVAVFIKAPIQGYFDASRRAELTDVADTALRRIARDLHLALPNSVRVTGGNQAIEFLQTRIGGRYRYSTGSSSADNILDFTQADSSFEILGPPILFRTGDQVVVYNLGIDGADAYQGNTAATHVRRSLNVAGIGSTTTVQIISSNPYPFDSPNHSFQVVDTPVSYLCDSATRTLTRYWGYDISATQPNPPSVGAGLKSAVLAKNVITCNFGYAAGVTERSGLVAIKISVGQNAESISLHHEVHVSNVP